MGELPEPACGHFSPLVDKRADVPLEQLSPTFS